MVLKTGENVRLAAVISLFSISNGQNARKSFRREKIQKIALILTSVQNFILIFVIILSIFFDEFFYSKFFF